jgi:hypothetical protein
MPNTQSVPIAEALKGSEVSAESFNPELERQLGLLSRREKTRIRFPDVGIIDVRLPRPLAKEETRIRLKS